MPLTLDRLTDILLQDEKERQQKESAKLQFDQDTAELDQLLRQVHQQHGITSPISGIFKRRTPPTLYTCPVSQAQTTLVMWSSLPRPVQATLQSIKPETEDALVEIPISFLVPQTEGGLSALQKRPLGGDLSDNLADYTRGASGVRRPFMPGGLDQQSTDQDVTVDAYRTDDAIERSLRPLDQSLEDCLDDLITAPPGVSFKAGLSIDLLRKDANTDALTPKTIIETEESLAPKHGANEQFKFSQEQSWVQNTIFTRDYFEEDSLFGSSSSDEDSDSDNEDDSNADSNNDNQVNAPVDEDVDNEYLDAQPKVANAKTNEQETIEPQDDDDDIDNLIVELQQLGDEVSPNKRKNIDTDNPLKLAERLARDQQNTARKSWASTSLLPIRDFAEYVPNPALTYPFTLDSFQQQAIARLERSENVFVAAHTSAGKTVVAEYAVALAKQRATRCIYTSPIKALSNQKFRDFSLKFGSENIGLITGDLQVNADDSTCIIMTTEILRSMLYRGADLVRDIEYVIFDEVHYVNDTERGVVWEEVIIMLPSYVNLVFLSATTPNTFEFSDWIGRTKRKPVYVVKTDYRPVPLSYHLWAGSKLHKVMEGKTFMENGYQDATRALLPLSAKDPKKQNDPKAKIGRPATGSKLMVWQQQGSKQQWMSLIRFLDAQLLTPTVVFTFSKKKCEEVANMLQSLDLNTARERGLIQGFTLQTISRLSVNDSALPQVLMISEMVQRGIGVHHGGLLPLLKEMVEILFSRNLIKVLFATETFAMGVNMPARSVVFNSTRKHDGTGFRNLEPGELTQMSGRAGRRGLDKVGTVVFCCFGEEPIPQPILRQMLTGSSTLLKSQFRLTYNMILNLLRVEEMSVESMIKRSFSEFATQRELASNDYPQLLRRGKKALEKLEIQLQDEAFTRVGAEDVEIYTEFLAEIRGSTRCIVDYIKNTEQASYESVLESGRVVFINATRKYGVVFAPAIVLKNGITANRSSRPGDVKTVHDDELICAVLLPHSFSIPNDYDQDTKEGTVGYIGMLKQRYYGIYSVRLEQIVCICSTRIKVDADLILSSEKSDSRPSNMMGGSSRLDPFAGMKVLGKKKDRFDDSLTAKSAPSNNLKKETVTEQVVNTLLDVEKDEKDSNGLKLLDLRQYLIRGDDVIPLRQKCDTISTNMQILRSMSSHRHPSIERYSKDVERLQDMRNKVKTLSHLLSNESLNLFPDFLQRKSVLKKLGYVDKAETVCIKGRVACEVNSCEELIATELVFEGLLNDMEPEEIAAVLSALVYQEKRDEMQLDSELPESIANCCNQMVRIAHNLGTLQKECGLEIDPGEYAEGAMKFGLVHVVYEWALGVPFKDICDLTDAQEGSIVRCITRLDELCREIRNCARVVGNPTLYRKMEAASTCIKRDIVFASSLYVS